MLKKIKIHERGSKYKLHKHVDVENHEKWNGTNKKVENFYMYIVQLYILYSRAIANEIIFMYFSIYTKIFFQNSLFGN